MSLGIEFDYKKCRFHILVDIFAIYFRSIPDSPSYHCDDMNETLTAAVLGVIQGLTEFLPVSSSGHLEIAKYVMGADALPEESMMMTVVLHFATALATLVVFRKEVGVILGGLANGVKSRQWNEHFDFSVKIILSMIPAVVVGVCFEDAIEALFNEQLLLVGLMLIVTAVLLLLADRAKSTEKKVGFVDAIIIGVAQAIAMLPGISRSGATISTSVLLGIDREKATQFSFLMVVPLILGYIAKKLLSDDFSFGDSQLMVPMLVGFVTAFASGYFACTWMIKLVRKSSLSYFSYYCLVAAAFAIYLSLAK
jgi:undecaprenyl-diphosphatase